jgi:branched-chain amino acid transport system substrate-binding protein
MLTRMLYEEQPLALMGSVDSAATHLAEQVVAKANLALVSPIATDKSLTLAGVPWMFSCPPADTAVARVLIDDVLGQLNASSKPAPQEKVRVAVLNSTDHESRMTAREVMKEFSRRGLAPAVRLEVPPNLKTFTQPMAALEESRSAAVILIASPEDAAGLVRAVRERFAGEPGAGRIQVFGSHSLGRTRFCELAGLAAEGVRFPRLFVPGTEDNTVARFMDKWTAIYDRPPDYTAAFAYDATRLLVQAIRRAGPNRARIREALLGLSPWHGIAGTIAFDGTGQNTRTNIAMGTIRNHALVPVHETNASKATLSQSRRP